MRISFTEDGNFEATTKWLNTVSKIDPTDAMQTLGQEGITSLRAATPVDTGATSLGWAVEIEKTRKGVEMNFVNRAHPGTSANVAMLIELGHGTRTGGYVPPRPYIKGALSNVFDKAGTVLVEGVMNK